MTVLSSTTTEMVCPAFNLRVCLAPQWGTKSPCGAHGQNAVQSGRVSLKNQRRIFVSLTPRPLTMFCLYKKYL